MKVLDDKKKVLDDESTAIWDAAKQQLDPLESNMHWYTALDTVNNILALSESKTVFLFDLGVDGPFELAEDRDVIAVANPKLAPSSLIAAVSKLNSTFKICYDVSVKHRYVASAWCSEGEFEESLRAEFSDTDISWEHLPDAYKHHKQDETTAYNKDRIIHRSPADLFEKGMFDGCGLDRWTANVTIICGHVIVLLPRSE